MPLDKHCAAKGCKGIPAFGFGSVASGANLWACRRHRGMIWPVDSSSAGRGEGVRGEIQAASSQLSTASQGSLI